MMANLFARAGVLFGGMGVLLLVLLSGGNHAPTNNTIPIVTAMVESLEDGQCPNPVCIAGLQLTDPITGAIDTFRVGGLHPEAFYYSPDYSKIGFLQGERWHILDLETRRSRLVSNDVVSYNSRIFFDPRLMAWSPDSTHIAYNSRNGIAIVDVQTGEHHLVSHLNAQQSLQWSPDGTHLLFSANPANTLANLDLYSLDLTTGELTNLTANLPYSYDGIWSPDGSQIVFLMSGRSPIGPGDLFIMNADGTNLERLTYDQTEYKWRPRWILDNTAIFYWARDYFQLDLETGELLRRDDNYKTLGQDISPDGSQFVQVQSIDYLAGDYLLTIYDFRTEESYDLPLKTYRATYPEWRSD
ncbi:MAG: hypothetical protein RLP44_28145 [Aggregatilineales bacterium]